MARAAEKAERILIEAQQKCEEMYLKDAEEEANRGSDTEEDDGLS